MTVAARAVKIHPADDVAVAVQALTAGDELMVEGERVVLADDVPTGHKLALRPLTRGQTVVKYGFPIGAATAPIACGGWVHSHNLKTCLEGVLEYSYEPISPQRSPSPEGRGGQGVRPTFAKARRGSRDALTASTASRTPTDAASWATTSATPSGPSPACCAIPTRAASWSSASAARTTRWTRSSNSRASPASDLILGHKCGGSDGLSGITANPLVGRIADRVTALGGGVILTEVPEMFGAERLLMNRAVDETVFRQIVTLINDFKAYFIRHGQPIYENPSPGNVAGGLTTLEEKSLGAIQKGGQATVTQVLRYGAPAATGAGGLALLESPGNDGVSSTALVASGATVLLFTTGRGTPLGFPVPTLKISSNTAIAEKKPHWIDLNAGAFLDGTATMDQLADDLFALILDVASGRALANNEKHGYREIAIWKEGVTL